MISSIHIPLKKGYLFKPVNLVAAGYLAIALFGLQNYLRLDSLPILFGMLAVLFAWKCDAGKKGSWRYGVVTLIMLPVSYVMPVKTMLFFCLGFATLFFAESFYGKTKLPALLIIVFASPVFQYLGNVFSFPIRLWLTQVAGAIFNFLGFAVQVRGNMIMHAGNEFSVDPACMGLNMITASLLSGLIFTGFYETKYRRVMKPGVVLFYLAIVFLLNILANLLRIILLVQFNVQPKTITHDLIGLSCLLAYVLIPALLLASFFARRSNAAPISQNVPGKISKQQVIAHGLMLPAIFLLTFKVSSTDTFARFTVPSKEQLPGYVITSPTPGVIKLEKAGVLIYVKYIRGFYDTEHNPMLCWTGSGYQFKNVSIENIAGKDVFTGIIANDTDKFYSAWWYDNGKKSTTSQVEWRWDLLTGSDHYVLVNVSCLSPTGLQTEIQRIINQETLAPFFR